MDRTSARRHRVADDGVTTEFQRRLSTVDAGTVVDLTRLRLARYVSSLRDPAAREAARALVGRYDSGSIAVAWRAGRPVYKDV